MRLEQWIRAVPLRLRSVFRRDAVEAELDDELRYHIDRQIEENVARGMDPAAARRNALIAIGGLDLQKEDCREAWGLSLIENLWRDVRYGFRSLARSPGFTLIAVVTLMLGIGANTAMFTVANAVLFRPLPYQDSDGLVVLGYRGTTVAPADFFDWKERSQSYESMALAEYWTPNLTGGEKPEEVEALHLSTEMLPMLGVKPYLGRVFLPEEGHAGRDHAVVLRYEFWNSRFGADRSILGRSITLNGEPFTIVGVMPKGFRFVPFWAAQADLAAPAVLDGRRSDHQGASWRNFARLKVGVTIDQARAELDRITADLAVQYPGTNKEVTLTPLKELVVGDVSASLRILLAAVGLVLLIACANVAHLQMVRAAAREREFAVRTALGGSRSRLVQQSLVESGILAAIGGALGLAFAYATVQLLVAFGPARLPRLDTIALDGRAVLFMTGVTLLAAFAFGAAPALAASRVNLHDTLKEGGRAGDSRQRRKLRNALVVSEFALAFILLAGAGLVLRSLFARLSLDKGFDDRGVLSMVVSLRGTGDATHERRAGFFRELIQRISALPGLESVSGINHLPLHGDNWHFPFAIEGRPLALPGEGARALFRVVEPGYFRTMGVPILQGRDFGRDEQARGHAVVVSEFMARRHWPGESPLGQRITVDDPATDPDWYTVIGVAGDVRQAGWIGDGEEEMYFPYVMSRDPDSGLKTLENFLDPVSLTLVIRGGSDLAGLPRLVEQTVHAMSPEAPVSDVITMQQAVVEQFAQPRFYTGLLGGFAAVALLLAAVGLYGVISYSAARRTREIGIRLALGADQAAALRLVVGEGLRLAAVGGTAGLAGAFLVTRSLQAMLYGVGPNDPATFVLVLLLLGLVGVVASWIPARRASRVNPVVALRSE